MMIKRILLLLAAVSVMAFAAGCDGEDGNTSGSAESNGVISDESKDKVSQAPNTSKEESRDLGDDISEMISDAGDDVSDFLSDVESGADSLLSDTESVISDVMDGDK